MFEFFAENEKQNNCHFSIPKASKMYKEAEASINNSATENL